MLGFSGDEILSIFKIIAVVLKLGNLNFIPITNIDGTEGCEITNDYGKRDMKIVKPFEIQLFFLSTDDTIFILIFFPFPFHPVVPFFPVSCVSTFAHVRPQYSSFLVFENIFFTEIRDIAQLLEIDEQIILNCLTKTGSSWMVIENGSELDAINANLINKALCRTLFGRLFTFVVNRLNESLKVRYIVLRRRELCKR